MSQLHDMGDAFGPGSTLQPSVSDPIPIAPVKLWLWRNFVDGRPEYWAFDNPFPVHLDCGDPQTLGEPCGYALFKPSRAGRKDVPEAEVIRRIKASTPAPAPVLGKELPPPDAEAGFLPAPEGYAFVQETFRISERLRPQTTKYRWKMDFYSRQTVEKLLAEASAAQAACAAAIRAEFEIKEEP